MLIYENNKTIKGKDGSMAIFEDTEFGLIETDEPIPPRIDIKKFGDENRQEFIDKYFNGDVEKYRTDTEQYNRNIISWQELVDYDSLYPEHKERAKKLIRICLGYMPPEVGTFFYNESKIRKAIERYNIEKYSEQKHFDEVYAIATIMRNEDMKIDNFCRLEYDERDMRAYTSTGLIPYSQIARDRLAHFLGYYPDLKFSLEAELFLRYYLADDNLIPKEKITAYDLRAMTIVKYREVLLKEGQVAADKSPLIGFQRIVELRS
ncbi:MAG: hypothetical protein J0L54_03835 [Chitinophagales bacterium]|nr:hypothetical protein [Chitinophagales bacterium]